MIRFSKYIWLYAFLSALVLVPGIFSLIRWGLRPSVDFTGGTLLEIRFSQAVDTQTVSAIVSQQSLPVQSIQKSSQNTFLLRSKPIEGFTIGTFVAKAASVSGKTVEVIRNETVGPILGKELLTKAVIAALCAIVAILFYVAYAFKNIKYGVSAVIALFHDLLVVLGCFSLLGHFLQIEVDTLFVTAFLTTMSFSVHDTIVVFDRIRELVGKGERMSFEEMSDRALTETMGRSLTNSFTILFMLVALILLGGETIRWFVAALLIGTVSGTYSSPFIATPVLILWHQWERKKK